MQIVIDVSDVLMKYIVNGKDLSEEQNDEMALAIANGKPLSKVIDRIIDSIETEASWECFDKYGNITGEWDSIRNVILHYRK